MGRTVFHCFLIQNIKHFNPSCSGTIQSTEHLINRYFAKLNHITSHLILGIALMNDLIHSCKTSAQGLDIPQSGTVSFLHTCLHGNPLFPGD